MDDPHLSVSLIKNSSFNGKNKKGKGFVNLASSGRVASWWKKMKKKGANEQSPHVSE